MNLQNNNLTIRNLSLFMLLSTALLALSCADRGTLTKNHINEKGVNDNLLNNILFVCDSMKNGDTIDLVFGNFGSLTNLIFKSRFVKYSDSIYLECFGQEIGEEKLEEIGKAYYQKRNPVDSISYEGFVFKVMGSKDIVYEQRNGYKRIIIIKSNRNEKVDIYLNKESELIEYLSAYFYQLIIYYFPNNQFIPKINEIKDK